MHLSSVVESTWIWGHHNCQGMQSTRWTLRPIIVKGFRMIETLHKRKNNNLGVKIQGSSE